MTENIFKSSVFKLLGGRKRGRITFSCLCSCGFEVKSTKVPKLVKGSLSPSPTHNPREFLSHLLPKLVIVSLGMSIQLLIQFQNPQHFLNKMT